MLVDRCRDHAPADGMASDPAEALYGNAVKADEKLRYAMHAIAARLLNSISLASSFPERTHFGDPS